MRRESLLLLYIVLALTGIGLLMVLSASTVSATSGSGMDSFHYFERQILYAVVGLAALMVAMRFDYHWFKAPIVYRSIAIVTLALLIAVLIPGIGDVRNNARRWIEIGGFTFQPSEFAKIALIVLLAVKLCDNRAHIKSFFRGLLPPMIITVVIAGLVVLEQDLGVPVVLCCVGLMMIFSAGARWIHLSLMGVPLAAAVAALIIVSPERVERLTIFTDPWQDPLGGGYNLIQSMAAFARGGFTGVGAGAGEQKLFYLPAAHTDFIYAVWAEETGLVGTLFVVGLYATFLIVALRVALCAPDLFGSLLATGITTLIGIQAAINMAVTIGLVPTKGLALPFISAGGTALIVNLGLAGILLNIGLQARETETEHGLAQPA